MQSMRTKLVASALAFLMSVLFVPELFAGESSPAVKLAVAPKYPTLNFAGRVYGKVTVRVTIDRAGAVKDTRVVQGHPMLREAAVNAARGAAQECVATLKFSFVILPPNSKVQAQTIFLPPGRVEIRQKPAEPRRPAGEQGGRERPAPRPFPRLERCCSIFRLRPSGANDAPLRMTARRNDGATRKICAARNYPFTQTTWRKVGTISTRSGCAAITIGIFPAVNLRLASPRDMARPAPWLQLMKLSGFPLPRTMYDRAPMLPGMIAILLGTFAGQQNEAKPMHPLGEILAQWAGLAQPEWKVPALVELREMDGEKGKFLFLFNHGENAAEVEFAQTLKRQAVNVREIVTGETRKAEGKQFTVKTEVQPQAVRITGLIIKTDGRCLLGRQNYAASKSSSGWTSSLPLVLLASKYVRMNGSMSPSSTRSTSPTPNLVRWSLIRR
jgi:TonB family protein